MHAKKLTSDTMHIKKLTTADAVLPKEIDPENTTSEQLRKVLALVRHQKDKLIPKKANDILIIYCQWLHV